MAAESPYATAIAFKRKKAEHVPNADDNDRVTAYWTYSDIYHNVEKVFEPMMRSDEDEEISRRLVPVARTLVEATNRYLAKSPTITPMPLATAPDGQPITTDLAKVETLMNLWKGIAAREEFFTVFGCMKRWLLIRGDALLHVTADDTKPEGERISIEELDPSTYFKIPNAINPNKIDGIYLVTIIANDNNDGTIAQRQEYRKAEGTGNIFTKVRFFETDKWDDRWPLTEEDTTEVDTPARLDIPAMQNLLTGFELDKRIRQIPVYHYRNRRQGGLQYGISELQGVETLLTGISQTATDEDLTMALTGIGVYVTDSGRPRDDNQNEVEWSISPASVIELEAGSKFDRVKGVDSVQPMLDHANMLESQARKTTGTPDVAVGTVEVAVAESGIALAIRMNPVLAKNEETEMELKLRTEQMLHDLVNGWLPVYEGYTPDGTELAITFDDPLPQDRAAVLEEILALVAGKVISVEFAQQIIRAKLGYDIPKDDLEKIGTEAAMLDPVGSRLAAEAAIPADPGAGAGGEIV